jgi:RNA binding exosome subunit
MVLSSKIPIGYIDIRVFAHATEELEKILNAVRIIIPEELVETITFKKTSLTGHHGNPITLLEARVKEKNVVQAVFKKLASSLSPLDKEILRNEIRQHLDGGNLYIRLDKQSAYLNEVKLCTTDPIHFRIHFQKHKPEEIIEICRKFGLFP